jgi:cysteine desulfurase
MLEKVIYLDNNATTKIDVRVLEAMMPYQLDEFGNASSVHQFGLSINKVVEESRAKVANLIRADANEIIFTSGATESINIALIGFALANQNKGRHIITVETEHKAVLDTCKYLEEIGFDISYLPVQKDGLLDLQDLRNALKNNTILVCVMFANNEIGVIQPIKEIAKIAHDAGIIFFSDATQAVGKVDIDIDDLAVDLMAFSGHKFYAPKGIGGLYVRGLKKGEIKLNPIIHGGGQENGLRSGTLNVPGIVGIGKASEISKIEMKKDFERISTLRNELESELLKHPAAFVNGAIENRMYNVSNICFPGIDANLMIGRMKNIAASNGSACTSAIIEPSHVLKAISLTDDDAFASIRFSLGRFNTKEEILSVVRIFNDCFDLV